MKRTTQRWVHRMSFCGSADSINAHLKSEQRDGWELVAVEVSRVGSGRTFYWKRPVDPYERAT